MRGSTKFQMPTLDGIDIEPKFKTAMDDLGRQLSAQFDNRPTSTEAQAQLLLYTPTGDAVWQVYVDETGALKTSKLQGAAVRSQVRNA